MRQQRERLGDRWFSNSNNKLRKPPLPYLEPKKDSWVILANEQNERWI